jgi:hypothetical protein
MTFNNEAKEKLMKEIASERKNYVVHTQHGDNIYVDVKPEEIAFYNEHKNELAQWCSHWDRLLNATFHGRKPLNTLSLKEVAYIVHWMRDGIDNDALAIENQNQEGNDIWDVAKNKVRSDRVEIDRTIIKHKKRQKFRIGNIKAVSKTTYIEALGEDGYLYAIKFLTDSKKWEEYKALFQEGTIILATVNPLEIYQQGGTITSSLVDNNKANRPIKAEEMREDAEANYQIDEAEKELESGDGGEAEAPKPSSSPKEEETIPEEPKEKPKREKKDCFEILPDTPNETITNLATGQVICVSAIEVKIVKKRRITLQMNTTSQLIIAGDIAEKLFPKFEKLEGSVISIDAKVERVSTEYKVIELYLDLTNFKVKSSPAESKPQTEKPKEKEKEIPKESPKEKEKPKEVPKENKSLIEVDGQIYEIVSINAMNEMEKMIIATLEEKGIKKWKILMKDNVRYILYEEGDKQGLATLDGSSNKKDVKVRIIEPPKEAPKELPKEIPKEPPKEKEKPKEIPKPDEKLPYTKEVHQALMKELGQNTKDPERMKKIFLDYEKKYLIKDNIQASILSQIEKIKSGKSEQKEAPEKAKEGPKSDGKKAWNEIVYKELNAELQKSFKEKAYDKMLEVLNKYRAEYNMPDKFYDQTLEVIKNLQKK